jgi:uncharacterized protein YtpQ (UPF0354 family)
MKRLLFILLVVILVAFRFSRPEVLSPGELTREVAGSVREVHPGVKVTVVRDLEIKLTFTDGRSSTLFLNNAYDTYKQNPKDREGVIHRYVMASLQAFRDVEAPLDASRIVPIVKDRAWLSEMRQAGSKGGSQKAPDFVFESLNLDLVVVYAVDSPQNIAYLTSEDLAKARIERGALRKLACENLTRLLPKIDRHGTDGLFMLTAGGNYEASLLLLEPAWRDLQKQVRGDLVVAIPARDLFLATGSQDAEGVAKLKKMVADTFKEGSYRLTPKLFVYRGGHFEEFHEDHS